MCRTSHITPWHNQPLRIGFVASLTCVSVCFSFFSLPCQECCSSNSLPPLKSNILQFMLRQTTGSLLQLWASTKIPSNLRYASSHRNQQLFFGSFFIQIQSHTNRSSSPPLFCKISLPLVMEWVLLICFIVISVETTFRCVCGIVSTSRISILASIHFHCCISCTPSDRFILFLLGLISSSTTASRSSHRWNQRTLASIPTVRLLYWV